MKKQSLHTVEDNQFGRMTVKHLHLTEHSPELVMFRQKLPLDAKINVVVAIQRERGRVGKIVRVGLDGTVCRECDVKKIQTLFNDRFEIDGQKHKIAPFEKKHLTLKPVRFPYNLDTHHHHVRDLPLYKESNQTFVMLLPGSLHKLHTQWWRQTYAKNTNDPGPTYDFKSLYQTVEEFYSAIRQHDYKFWPKHKEKLAAYGLTPEGIIEATKYGQQWDNAMMNCEIMSEWLQKEKQTRDVLYSKEFKFGEGRNTVVYVVLEDSMMRVHSKASAARIAKVNTVASSDEQGDQEQDGF